MTSAGKVWCGQLIIKVQLVILLKALCKYICRYNHSFSSWLCHSRPLSRASRGGLYTFLEIPSYILLPINIPCLSIVLDIEAYIIQVYPLITKSLFDIVFEAIQLTL